MTKRVSIAEANACGESASTASEVLLPAARGFTVMIGKTVHPEGSLKTTLELAVGLRELFVAFYEVLQAQCL